LKDYEKALEFYNKAIEMKPFFQPVYNDLAALFDREGKPKLAEEYLLKAIRLAPNSTEANYNLALTYLRDGESDKAIRHLEKVSDQSPFKERALSYLGIAYKQKGQFGRALIYFKKALAVNPKNIKLYLHVAEVFDKIGEHKKAEEQVEKAFNLINLKEGMFSKILGDLHNTDRSKNLKPQPDVVVPLMRDLCLRKSETFRQWSELLGKEFNQEKNVVMNRNAERPVVD
jgi:tetratricopeptide (TPR) repeat protein